VTRIEGPFLDDRALAAAVAAGDAPSRERVVRRLMARVRAVTRRVLGGAPDADDAAQNAMLEVLRSAHTYQGHVPLEAWSDRISARVALRQAETGRRRLSVVAQEETLPDAPDLRAPSPDVLDVGVHVRALPEVQRHTIELKYGLGFSVEEIAEAMGVSPNTVKTRLKAGLRGLRAAMHLNPAGEAS
jgi:RNA polymerase sigma-70 factor (ECF subfamily)